MFSNKMRGVALGMAAAMSLGMASTASATLYINEVYFNPGGGAPENDEYVEIKGVNGTDSTENLWFVALENEETDTNSAGIVDFAVSLSGASLSDGYIVMAPSDNSYSGSGFTVDVTYDKTAMGLEASGATYMLVRSTTAISVGDDYETDTTSMTDLEDAPWYAVVDSVAVVAEVDDISESYVFSPVVFAYGSLPSGHYPSSASLWDCSVAHGTAADLGEIEYVGRGAWTGAASDWWAANLKNDGTAAPDSITNKSRSTRHSVTNLPFANSLIIVDEDHTTSPYYGPSTDNRSF